MSKVINLRAKRCRSKPIVHKDRKNYNFNKLYGEKYKLLFLLISISEIFVGAICYKITDNSQLTQVIAENFAILNNGNFKPIFIFLLKLDLIYFLISFFIGTSFIGAVLSFIPPTLKCIGNIIYFILK